MHVSGFGSKVMGEGIFEIWYVFRVKSKCQNVGKNLLMEAKC